jgi:D-alanyl-D-alanine carboxypeptidase/D-alanyl-D-alanine-endopeptidase (penicillin-binding protein 4)
LSLVLCGGLALAWTASAAFLPAPVADALAKAGIPARRVAVLVQGLDEETPLIAHNTDALMNPASVMKLVSTYAALEILGPAHTWKTEALASCRPVNGRLEGNLYLRGRGDPRLALEQFWLFLRQLRSRGVTQIDGDLVLDRSEFSLPPHDPEKFDKKTLRPYNAGPDALLVNLKSISIALRVNSEGTRIETWPETPGVEGLVQNRLKPGQGACGDWREGLRIIPSGKHIVLSGIYPASCGEKTLHLSPWSADFQLERIFRALWQELGGTLRGQVRAGTSPPDAQALAEHRSPTLSEIVRETNKFSNNVMARQIFLALDPERPATLEGARGAMRAWLSGKGLDLPDLVIDNGSGLSREARISARSLARLLHFAWKSPVMPEFISALPLAGVDGTLRKRMNIPSVAGRAHLKTGYLENVSALAGYALDGNGRRWIIVFLINDPRSSQGGHAMEALLQWLLDPDGKYQ